MTAKEIIECWDAVKTVFGTATGPPRATEWIDLLRVIDAGEKGMPLETLRNHRNSGQVRKRVNRWIRAGLVQEWHDLHAPRNPINRQFPLVLRATPKALTFLRVTS
jgi:hypothetical protein